MKKPKNIMMLIVVVLLALNITTYADLFEPITFIISIENNTADNGRESAINTASNIMSGTYYLVDQAYLESQTEQITIEMLENARLVVPKIVSSFPFEEVNVYYPVPTYALKEGLYQMLAFDSGGNLLAMSNENITITQAETSANQQLRSIAILGNNIPGFEPEKYNYVIELSEEETLRINGDYLGAVTAETMDPETLYEKYIAEDNIVVIDPYSEGPMIISAPNFKYTVHFIPFEGEEIIEPDEREEIIEPDIDEPEISNDRIDRINGEINQLVIENMTGPQLRGRVMQLTYEMIEIIDQISDAETAEQTYTKMADTVALIGNAIPYMDESPPIARQIGILTNRARRLVGLIDNQQRVANLTVIYFDNMQGALSALKRSDYQTKYLKNKVYDLANEVIAKTGTYHIPMDTISIENRKGTVRLTAPDVIKHMDTAKLSYNKINGAAKRLLGYADPRNLIPQFILQIKKSENVDALSSELSKDVLNLALKRGYQNVGINLGDVGVTFSSRVLSANDELLNINVDFESNANLNLPASTSLIGEGLVANIEVESDNKPITIFDKPIEIRFNLTEWQVSKRSNQELNYLSLYVLNEDEGVWETIGGNYDPITQIIRANRMKLSKYTVMETNKLFSDVDHSWAQDEINELLGKGVIDEATTFSPKTAVNRDDFTTWLARAYGLQKEDLTVPFLDVSNYDVHYTEISTAYNQGIISGKSDTSFDPLGNITREEIATIVSNALTILESKTYSSESESNIEKYLDYDDISSWAKRTVALVDELGIMRGDDVTFRPKDNVTREEAAAIIKRVYD